MMGMFGSLLQNIGSLLDFSNGDSTTGSENQKRYSISNDGFKMFFRDRMVELWKETGYESNNTIDYDKLNEKVMSAKMDLENDAQQACGLIDFIKLVETLPPPENLQESKLFEFKKFDIFKNVDHLEKVAKALFERDNGNTESISNEVREFIFKFKFSIYNLCSDLEKGKINNATDLRFLGDFNRFHRFVKQILKDMEKSNFFLKQTESSVEIFKSMLLSYHKYAALNYFIVMFLEHRKGVNYKERIVQSCLRAIAFLITPKSDFLLSIMGYERIGSAKGTKVNPKEDFEIILLEELHADKEKVDAPKTNSTQVIRPAELILNLEGDLDVDKDMVIIPRESEGYAKPEKTTEEIVADSKSSESIPKEEKNLSSTEKPEITRKSQATRKTKTIREPQATRKTKTVREPKDITKSKPLKKASLPEQAIEYAKDFMMRLFRSTYNSIFA